MKKLCLVVCLMLYAVAVGATGTEPYLKPARPNGVMITFGDAGHAMTAPVFPSVVVTPIGVVTL